MDSSELGWRVVHEYETNPFAEDSKNERKLYNAENKADRKAKAKKTKKARRVHPYVQPSEKATMARKPGRRFNCDVKGHWKKECPELQQQRKNDKISNLNTLSGADNYDECTTVSQRIRTVLIDFGFIIAEEKCNWNPVQVITFWEWYGIPLKGVLGTTVRLRTRYAYDCVLDRTSLEAPVWVTPEAEVELKFWLSNVERLNADCALFSQLTNEACDVNMFSDDSGEGYGEYIAIEAGNSKTLQMCGAWDAHETSMSSTWRELQAVHRVFKLIWLN
ncbi:unnamed protein product [Mytilus coruscus]|uniref:CCHC-type domain-containing protein n=1 Tax=Mytilus coruscus TaxID=42192 RepID=A0A6J8CAN1_MYTCO|nr:unnamed protein product [Mytilus coruscus]